MTNDTADAKAGIAAVFDQAAPTYDAVGVDFFGHFGRRLVAIAELSAGERVLDVGCGRGASAFPAAEAVGASGSVLGIDLAPGMVERTAGDAAARGLGWLTTRVGDAEDPAVPPGSVDVVLAGLILFFLPDLPAALRRYAEALVPGGRLAVTSFAGDDPRWKPVFDAVNSFMPEGSGPPRPPGGGEDGPFSSTERLHSALETAGYVEPVSVVEEHVTRFRDGDHWVEWSRSHGLLALWLAVGDRRAEAEEAARAEAGGVAGRRRW